MFERIANIIIVVLFLFFVRVVLIDDVKTKEHYYLGYCDITYQNENDEGFKKGNWEKLKVGECSISQDLNQWVVRGDSITVDTDVYFVKTYMDRKYKRTVDVYVNSSSEAMKLGRKYKKVFVILED